MKQKILILLFVCAFAAAWVFNPYRRVGHGRHHETTRARWDRLTRPLRRPGIRWRARRRAARARARAEAQAWAWWVERRTDYTRGWGVPA